jgi:multisubunit Na+/H+ antiporter MnhB subunit
MTSYLTIGALVAGAITVVLLVMSIMLGHKDTPSDDERKSAGTFQIISLVLVLVSLALMTVVTFYPSIGQWYQKGSRGADARSAA